MATTCSRPTGPRTERLAASCCTRSFWTYISRFHNPASRRRPAAEWSITCDMFEGLLKTGTNEHGELEQKPYCYSPDTLCLGNDSSNPTRHLLRHLVRDGDAERLGGCLIDDQ